MANKLLLFLAAAAAAAAVASGFVASPPSCRHHRGSVRLRTTVLLSDDSSSNTPPCQPTNADAGTDDVINADRRAFLQRGVLVVPSAFALACTLTFGALPRPPPASAVERAVGSAEQSCRDAGNCLERGDWDGAVGWNWGGRDRCDATDPLCGPDGQLRDAPASGGAVPSTKGLAVTDVVELELSIGREERGTLRIGLYGNDCPKSVSQLVQFCSSERLGGLSTTSKLLLEEGYGAISVPVALGRGGILNVIYPNQRLDFGVPSQAAAYARSKNLNKAGDGFVPQPRPSSRDVDAITAEPTVRAHDVPGLVSMPKSGLGFGGSGFEGEDEAYESAFQITSGEGPVPAMDREGRRVVGQLMDEQSMAVLGRLSSLPTKKGLKGVIPGQNAGPPLLKVTVNNVDVAPSSSSSSSSSAS